MREMFASQEGWFQHENFACSLERDIMVRVQPYVSSLKLL